MARRLSALTFLCTFGEFPVVDLEKPTAVCAAARKPVRLFLLLALEAVNRSLNYLLGVYSRRHGNLGDCINGLMAASNVGWQLLSTQVNLQSDLILTEPN
jgi:hypothetical protein